MKEHRTRVNKNGSEHPSPHKESQKFTLRDFLLALITGAISAGVSIYAVLHELKKDEYDQDLKAVQMSAELEKTWESEMNTETRWRFVRFIEVINKYKNMPEVRKRVELAIIREDYLYDPNDIKHDKIVMSLLGMQPGADDILVSKSLNEYRTAIFVSLNAMESLSTISCFFSHSDTTRRIIDIQYRGIIEKRRDELKEFIDLYNQEMHQKRGSDYKAWSPLYMAFNTGPSSSKECPKSTD